MGKVSSMRWGICYSLVKAIMIVLMAMVVLSPSVSSALHQCADHEQSVSRELTTLDQHSETDSASHHESHDCACPTHRVDCCHYQATPTLPKFNFVSVYFALVYNQGLFIIPNSPLLEGPFQPPRA